VPEQPPKSSSRRSLALSLAQRLHRPELVEATREIYEMSEVPFPNEMIAKLVKAGYLRPEHQHDADAITSAIGNMKQDLRSGGSDDNDPAAA
jgi:hypothetical protein